MNSLLRNILNVFYPRCCSVCQKILKDQNRLICPECEKKLKPIGQPRCYLCGKPVEKGEYCADCLRHPHIFDQGRGIFVYDDRMRNLFLDINTVDAGNMESFMPGQCIFTATGM